MRRHAGQRHTFLDYNFKRGWDRSSAPIMTADWTAGTGQKWTVPVGFGGGKLWRVGKVGLPVSTQIQGFHNAVRPDFAVNWQLRAQVQFLFPK